MISDQFNFLEQSYNFHAKIHNIIDMHTVYDLNDALESLRCFIYGNDASYMATKSNSHSIF